MSDTKLPACRSRMGHDFKPLGEPYEKHKIGDTEAEWAGLGEALKSTRFGLQALLLDTTGILSQLGGKVARFTIVTDI